MTGSTTKPRLWPMFAAGTALLLIGAGAGWFYESRLGSGSSNKAEIEAVVESYLLENPEILIKVSDKLKEKQASAQIDAAGDDLEKPYPGMVLGNPNGKVVLVEFSDYACTYCRRSVSDVEALIAQFPDLKVVVREMPILSPDSAAAAKMAMAAAQQGKFAAFHKAMFAAGRVNGDTIGAAARVAGLDMVRAQATIADPSAQAELTSNVDMARELGFNGTPSWVVGEQAFSGAVGRDELAAAIQAAAK